MKSFVTRLFVAAFLLLAPTLAHAALAPYGQTFEGLSQSAPNALSADGWLVYANVFSPDHSAWFYGYGPFPAPNNTGAFCGIDFVTGSPPQGAQDMVVYNDYNNGDHAAGNQIEALTFREQTVAAGDAGQTWTFRFEAKMGNLEAPSTAFAFVKTLDPGSGYATTNFISADMTSIPGSWTTYEIAINVLPSMAGNILQFGFGNTASNYKGSGVFYDNVQWFQQQPVSSKSTTWGRVKALYR